MFCSTGVSFAVKTAKEILKSIAKLWTTIRGFSSKSYMEIYMYIQAEDNKNPAKVKGSLQKPPFRQHRLDHNVYCCNTGYACM